MSRLEQIAGALVFLLGLTDVFLTVLYARAGTGVLSRAVTAVCWRFMLVVSKLAGRSRATVLSLGGPLNLALLVATWSTVLALGAALIVQPELGRAVRPSSGTAQTDFTTALYVGGSSLSLVGSSDYEPRTGPFRLLFLFNAVVGTSVISLTLTYLMQVYSALRERNALALSIETLTSETGDAARLLAAVAPKGDFSAANSNLGSLASQMISAKEAHHFYPVLFYFRFENPRYAVARFTFVALDAVSLLRAALDGAEADRLKVSGAVEQLDRASLMLVQTLKRTFVPEPASRASGNPCPGDLARWRARFSQAVGCLADAGLPLNANRAAGEARYVALRAHWDGDVASLTSALGLDPEAVDTALTATRCSRSI